MTGDEDIDRDNVDRMNEFDDLREITRVIRKNALEADDAVDGCMWIAAGGRGFDHLDELREYAENLRRHAELLEAELDEVPDPREVREDA